MAILITGGAGFIGSHTAVELLDNNHEIIIIDNFDNSNPKTIERIRRISNRNFAVYEADLLDYKALERIFSENKIEVVIHFAGLKSVSESILKPLNYYSNNLISTINLCNIMNKYGVKKMVFSSSATVYGYSNKMPITEESEVSANNPYGRTKLMVEEILRDLSKSDSEWNIILLRYFNPIGAHPSGLIGEDPKGIPNNLMPYITQVAIGKRSELKIFGNNYPTDDGTGIRDYIHVVDLAKGHLAAINKIMNMSGLEVYNLGTGKGYSVLEVIKSFESVTGKQIQYKIVGERQGDVPVCYADVTKANNELGWKAEKGLDDMCYDAWNWQVKNPSGYSTVLKTN